MGTAVTDTLLRYQNVSGPDIVLWDEKTDHVKEFLPVFVYIGVLMVIGSVGGILVCYVFAFHMERSPHHFFIVSLAVVDLLQSALAMPYRIVELHNFRGLENELACRLTIFLSAFNTGVANCTLVLIAANRYQKICRPTSVQLSMQQARTAEGAVVLLVMVLITPVPYLSGMVRMETDVPGVYVRHCQIRREHGELLPLLYFTFLGFSIIAVLLALGVLYARIWCRMRSEDRRRGSAHVAPLGEHAEQGLPQHGEVPTPVGRGDLSGLRANFGVESMGVVQASREREEKEEGLYSAETKAGVNNVVNKGNAFLVSAGIGEYERSPLPDAEPRRSPKEGSDGKAKSFNPQTPSPQMSPSSANEPSTRPRGPSFKKFLQSRRSKLHLPQSDRVFVESTTAVSPASQTDVGRPGSRLNLFMYGIIMISSALRGRSDHSDQLPMESTSTLPSTSQTYVRRSKNRRSRLNVFVNTVIPITSFFRRLLAAHRDRPNQTESDRVDPTQPNRPPIDSTYTVKDSDLEMASDNDSPTSPERKAQADGLVPDRSAHLDKPQDVQDARFSSRVRYTSAAMLSAWSGRLQGREGTVVFPAKGKRASHVRASRRFHARTTLTAFAVTATFMVSFLPYLCLRLLSLLNPEYTRSLHDVPLTLFLIGLRSYFISPAANPVIYGMLNARFRATCVLVLGAIFTCKKVPPSATVRVKRGGLG